MLQLLHRLFHSVDKFVKFLQFYKERRTKNEKQKNFIGIAFIGNGDSNRACENADRLCGN